MNPNPQEIYTITKAADWGMFVFMYGLVVGLIAVLSAIIVFMWVDLRKSIKEDRKESRKECILCKHEMAEEHKCIWTAIDDCCPRASRMQNKEAR
jgi:hypothetical protein